MKIGKLVRRSVRAIITHFEAKDPSEFDRLLDEEYSKNVFGISYPFFAVVDKIPPKDHGHYWADIYQISETQVRATNDWYDDKRNQPSKFRDYIQSKNIDIPDNLDEMTTSHQSVGSTARAMRKNSRYRSPAVGNAQNYFIRNILSNLGTESFDENKWKETIQYFEERCVYCGVDGKLIIDHAIPINKKSLGEHRLGNLVPSCGSCNSKKGSQDYREFLKNDSQRRQRIEEYMRSREYFPLEENKRVARLLEMAHEDVGALAQRYIKIINEIMLDEKQ